MLKFKANPTSEQSAELTRAAQRLEAAHATLAALGQRHAELIDRCASLSREEITVSDAIKTAQRDDSRRIATELAAIRIEITEANRQRSEVATELEAATAELRNASGDVGNAIEVICQGLFADMKAAKTEALAPFFTDANTAQHIASTTQTDMDRAVISFSQSFRRDVREPDDALVEAERRLDVVRTIENGSAVFEWPKLRVAA